MKLHVPCQGLEYYRLRFYHWATERQPRRFSYRQSVAFHACCLRMKTYLSSPYSITDSKKQPFLRHKDFWEFAYHLPESYIK